jgi:hypothetical protein
MTNGSKYNLSNAHIGTANIESTIYGNQVGFQQNNAVSVSNLQQEVHTLLDRLTSQTLSLSPAQRQGEVEKAIYQNPALRNRLKSALKDGGVEALKQIFNHPAIHIPVEVIKGWLEAE